MSSYGFQTFRRRTDLTFERGHEGYVAKDEASAYEGGPSGSP